MAYYLNNFIFQNIIKQAHYIQYINLIDKKMITELTPSSSQVQPNQTDNRNKNTQKINNNADNRQNYILDGQENIRTSTDGFFNGNVTNLVDFVNKINVIGQKIYDKTDMAVQQLSSNFINRTPYQLQNIILNNQPNTIYKQYNTSTYPSYTTYTTAANPIGGVQYKKKQLKVQISSPNPKKRPFVIKQIQFDKNNPSDRALELSYRMAKQRLDRQKQYYKKNKQQKLSNQPSINNVSTINTNTNINTNGYRQRPKSIDPINQQTDYNQPEDQSSNTSNIRRRTLNIGKIVKRNNIPPIYLSKSIDNGYFNTIDMVQLRTPNLSYNITTNPYNNSFIYNLNNIDKQWNENGLGNNNSLLYRRKIQKQQKQRQLKILEMSQRRNQKYHIRKFIISFIIDISNQAVDRIQQKRTFFSYRIHRYNKNPIPPLPTSIQLPDKSTQKSRIARNLQNSQVGMGRSMIRLADSIHPKHQRAIQNTKNIHTIQEILNKSRVNKEEVSGFIYENQNQTHIQSKGDKKLNKSRIQNVFTYTIEGKNKQQSNKNTEQNQNEDQIENKSNNQDQDQDQEDQNDQNDQDNQDDNKDNKDSNKDDNDVDKDGNNDEENDDDDDDNNDDDDDDEDQDQDQDQDQNQNQNQNQNQDKATNSKQYQQVNNEIQDYNEKQGQDDNIETKQEEKQIKKETSINQNLQRNQQVKDQLDNRYPKLMNGTATKNPSDKIINRSPINTKNNKISQSISPNRKVNPIQNIRNNLKIPSKK